MEKELRELAKSDEIIALYVGAYEKGKMSLEAAMINIIRLQSTALRQIRNDLSVLANAKGG